MGKVKADIPSTSPSPARRMGGFILTA